MNTEYRMQLLFNANASINWVNLFFKKKLNCLGIDFGTVLTNYRVTQKTGISVVGPK